LFEYGNDPCDKRFLKSGSNPTVRQTNCAAAGIPTNFVSTITDATIQGLGGGNSHLGNEIAHSWTVGGSFSPTFIRGLTLTADYIHINIDNEILQPGIQSEMQACYDSPSYPNSPFCSTFQRDAATHQITAFTDNYINIGTQAFRAIQVNASWHFPLHGPNGSDLGNMNISANYLHEMRNDYVVGTGSTQYNHDQKGEPADSVTTNLIWSYKKIDWAWTFIYQGPTVVNPNSAASDYQYFRVSPYWMINSSVGLNVTEHLKMRLIVNNLFNFGVTYAGPVPEFSTNKEFDAVLGRSFRVSASVKF
jgi:outer membrane receptor protein involved in Fe transport